MRSCPRCLAIYVGNAEFCSVDGERVVESDKDPLIGSKLDRYVIEKRLGYGGMASVYRAKHEVLGRDHAIKLLHGEMQADKRFAERFRREAQAIAKIEHPNVVKIVDFGVTTKGLHFLVMELLDGMTLQDVLRDKGPLTPKRAASIAKQIASGLAVAHAAGFIHRDLKPGNVMLVKEGGEERAKILDFGLVRMAADDDDELTKERLTRTGVAMGTPHYMAPEQFRGHETTAASDLYSLGVVLYEMLSGARPYVGSLPEIIVQQAAERRRTLDPAGGLEEIVSALLSTDPKERPKTAREVLEWIDRLGDLPDRREPKGSSAATKAQRIRRSSVLPAKPKPKRVKKRVRVRWGVIGAAATAAALVAALLARGSFFGLKDSGHPAKAVVRELKDAESHVVSVAQKLKSEAEPPPAVSETAKPKPNAAVAKHRSPPPAKKHAREHRGQPRG